MLLTACICGALPMTGSVAENTLTVDTPALGMTGWRADPPVVNTQVLGMTGWRSDPVVVNTPALGMTGWRTDAPKVLSGTLDLRDPHGSACPRQAEASLSLKTDVAGPVPFSLDCTGDRSWSQTATAHETGPNTYIAVAVLQFDIRHEEQVNCALKSRLQSPPKILALRGHSYDCTKTGPDRIVTPPPTGVPPPVVVDPPRPAQGRVPRSKEHLLAASWIRLAQPPRSPRPPACSSMRSGYQEACPQERGQHGLTGRAPQTFGRPA
jgi:hypothetical protein